MGAGQHYLTDAERAILAEPSWYGTFQLLELMEPVDIAAFRDKLGARTPNDAEVDPVELHRQVLDQIVATDVDTVRMHLLGRSGVLAGQAREVRDRYYETGDLTLLSEAIDLFLEAIAINDEPLRHDGAKTMQGFAATLIDLAAVDGSTRIRYIAAVSFLAAMASDLTSLLLSDHLEIVGRSLSQTATVSQLCRQVADEIEAPVLIQVADEVDDLRLAVERLHGPDPAPLGPAILRASAVVLAARAILPQLPPSTTELDDRLGTRAELLLGVAVHWLDRYAADAGRLFVRDLLADTAEDEGHTSARGEGAPEPNAGSFLEAEIELGLRLQHEAHLLPEGLAALIALRVTVHAGGVRDPRTHRLHAISRELVEQSRRSSHWLLGTRDVPPRSSTSRASTCSNAPSTRSSSTWTASQVFRSPP